MVKKLLSGTTILVAVVLAFPVLAEDSSTAPTPTHMDKSFKEKMQELKGKKMEIKRDLRKVKDEKKKTAAEKISEELVALNEKRLKHFSNSLDQLEKVLAGTAERVNKRAEKGFDTTNVKAAIEEAKTAIAAGRAAIDAQKSKTYKIEATTDAGLKEAIKTVRKSLEADLKLVQDAVKKVKEAVHKTMTMLAKVRKEKKVSPISTVLPSISPSTSE